MTSELLIVISALIVGASLASAGAVLQSVLRNPLAEPFMLGIVGGAALFAATAMHFGLGSWALVPAFAFAGACFSLALVCAVALLASRNGRSFGGETVILAGFVSGSFTGSLQMVLLSYAKPDTYAKLSKWLFGDLHSARPLSLLVAAILGAVAFAIMYSQNRNLNALALGDESAASVGVNVKRTVLLTLGAASLATAASVAIAGAIGFLGLVVPHFVRRVFGGNHRVYLPLSAVFGGLFLLGADWIGRLFPAGVSAGVVCAVIGSPFFLYLLVLKRRH